MSRPEERRKKVRIERRTAGTLEAWISCLTTCSKVEGTAFYVNFLQIYDCYGLLFGPAAAAALYCMYNHD